MNNGFGPGFNRLASLVGGLACFCGATFAVAAEPSIVVGSHSLLPDTAHQPITIHVNDVAAVGMLNLNAQIGNGTGAAYAVFDGVDLTTGTIFAGNYLDPLDTGSAPRLATWSIVTATDTVSVADGLLATLYVDTTGVSSGTYTLSLGETLNGPTVFYDATGINAIPIAITDGSFTVAVPEPGSLSILLLAAPALLRRRRT